MFFTISNPETIYSLEKNTFVIKTSSKLYLDIMGFVKRAVLYHAKTPAQKHGKVKLTNKPKLKKNVVRFILEQSLNNIY